MIETGFILTAHCLDAGGRCELHYYGKGINGPFKLVFSPHKPVFFIRRDTEQKFTSGIERREVNLTDIGNNPVDALYFNTLNGFFEARRHFRDTGVRMYESDIRAEDRFLMERFINGSLEIKGNPQKKGPLDIYYNPGIRPSGSRPSFTVLSLDIETGTDGSIYSIALHCSGEYANEQKTVLMRSNTAAGEEFIAGGTIKICYFSDEDLLLRKFNSYIKLNDPDLIIGWHVIGFDLDFIRRRCEQLGVQLDIGRGPGRLKINEKRNGMFSTEIKGRVVIDGPQTLRTAFYKFENYRLETVARKLLGRGKDITPETDKVAEIERRFRENKKALAFYNMEDSVLVTEIFRKTAIIEQMVTRSLITGLPIDKVHMSVAAFDHFMLPQFHRKGIVAPDTADVVSGDHAAGGHVFTSAPGLYPHVVVLDFKSLYPTIMRTFFIDPYSRLKSETDTVETPSGIAFSRTKNILPDFLEVLMERRARAKLKNDGHLSQAVKILLNSFYGVMGTTGCRFYHPDLPTAITGTGQWVLKNCAEFLRNKGYNVIYGDTDSVFVQLKHGEQQQAALSGTRLAESVNRYFSGRLEKEYDVESKLEIEFEKHYLKFFLPPMRNTTEGARKKYAGLLESGEIEFKGLEIVRSDWTELAGNFQQELFRRFFNDEDLKSWIRSFVEDLKNGKFDEQLIYRRRLKRSAEKYVKTSPPHVKAARKLDPEGIKNLTEISYLITADGPTPLELVQGPPDYAHYIEKQIKPIADGVLFLSGDSFDSLIDGQQLDLFD